MHSHSQSPILTLRNICKSFGGVNALNNVSFDLRAGEVHTLCGENGAGKSTLISVLSGAIQPDRGTITIGSRTVSDLSPNEAQELGVATIYQENVLFQGLSVAENIFVGAELKRASGAIEHKQTRRRAAEILDRLGAPLDVGKPLASLGAAQQKIVEIARAFRQKARVIIMDEPSASFGHHEVSLLFRTVREVSSSGTAIIFISHHMEEVFELSDRISVLRDGEMVGTFEAQTVTEGELIRLMVGRSVDQVFHHRPAMRDETVLSVRNVSGAGVRDISFDLKKGEVLGIAGLVGSGRSELLGLLYGSLPRQTGTLQVHGKPVEINSPVEAMTNGICLITEDRKLDGLLLEQSYLDNFLIATLPKYARPALNWPKARRDALAYRSRLSIDTPGLDTRVTALSGGNQQKVILARCMNVDPDIYLFDEPTRGVDVGAKEEIYTELQKLVDAGKSVILVSSELPEIVGLCDRVFVMKDGAAVRQLAVPDFTQSDILEAAL